MIQIKFMKSVRVMLRNYRHYYIYAYHILHFDGRFLYTCSRGLVYIFLLELPTYLHESGFTIEMFEVINA